MDKAIAPIEEFPMETAPETQTEKIPENLQTMTEEEAFKDLGLERIPIYQGLEEMLQKRSPLARRVVDFLKETYPEQIPILLATHKMEELLDQRVEEAKTMFLNLHPTYQQRENLAQMDTLKRIQTENQIAQTIWEEINQEVLYRPLSF